MAHSKLSRVKSWLLIIDNLEIDLPFFSFLNNGLCKNGRVIITTRNQNLVPLNQFLQIVVPSLKPYESQWLFERISHCKLRPEERQSFLKELPQFPLDISTVAYYIRVHQIDYQTYLKSIFRNRTASEMLQGTIKGSLAYYPHYREGIIETGCKAILAKHALFAGLLLYISLFDSQRIPQEFLESIASPALVALFLHTLKSHSMIAHRDRQIYIHRSIQAIMFDFLKEEMQDTLRDREEKIIKEVCQYGEKIINQGDIKVARLLLIHVLSMARKIPEGSLLKPLHALAGNLYFLLGHYPEAQKSFEKSLIYSSFSSSVQDTKIWADLAMTLKKVGRYKDMEKFLKKGIFLYKENAVVSSQEHAWLLLQIGNMYNHLDRAAPAQHALEKSLSFYENRGKRELEPHKASNFIYLGNTYYILDDNKKALSQYLYGLRIYQSLYGNYHCKTVWAWVHVANALRYLGRYKEAEPIIKWACCFYEKNFHDNKDNLAWCLASLGELYRQVGLFDEAVQALEKSTRVLIQYWGESHIQTARWSLPLGKLYTERGEVNKAIPLMNHILETHKQQFSCGHIRIAWVKHALANTYKKIDPSRSFALLQEALSVYGRKFVKNSLNYAQAICDLGEVYLVKKDYQEAERCFRESLRTLEEQQHPYQFKCIMGLGDVYVAQDEMAQAHNYFRKAYKIVQAQFPPNSFYIRQVREKLKMFNIDLSFERKEQ